MECHPSGSLLSAVLGSNDPSGWHYIMLPSKPVTIGILWAGIGWHLIIYLDHATWWSSRYPIIGTCILWAGIGWHLSIYLDHATWWSSTYPIVGILWAGIGWHLSIYLDHATWWSSTYPIVVCPGHFLLVGHFTHSILYPHESVSLVDII